MRRIREVLRREAGVRLSDRQIAAVIGSARPTDQEFLRRVRTARIGWPLPAGLDDNELIPRLCSPAAAAPRCPTPDLPTTRVELAQQGVTRMLLGHRRKPLARRPESGRQAVDRH